MVAAISRGGRATRAAQCAARASSAVESGPPETASNSAGASASSAKRASASASETGGSTTGTLLFSLRRLLHTVRGFRVFPAHFAQGRAGELVLIQSRERLAETQQRIRSLGMGFVLLRHVQERSRGVAVILTLEHAFAKPELGFGGEPVLGILLQKGAQCLLRLGVILALQVAVAEIVLVTRARRRRQGRGRADCARIARRRWRRRQTRVVDGRIGHRREVKRGAGRTA